MNQSSTPSAPMPTSRSLLTTLGSLALLLLLAPAVFAQDPAGAAIAPAIVETKTLWDKVMLAGPSFMLMLFLASVFMVWLIFDGILTTRRKQLVPPATVATVRQHLIDGHYVYAAQAAISDNSVFGQVSAAAFTKIGLGKDATDDAIFEETERCRGAFNSRISYLSVIGVITPMIGLTGTVLGMIKAFDTLGSSGVGDPSKLSEAIGHVLVCTAGGLVVAIPAFAFYYVMRNRIAAGFRYLQSDINAIFHHLPYEHLKGVRLEADAFVPALPRNEPGAS
jgi:biopolymer transport protein ExbB